MQFEKWHNRPFPSRLTLLCFGLLLGLMSCYDNRPPGDMDYLDVSEDMLKFPAEGGEQTIVIVTEGKWIVESKRFFHLTPQFGIGPALLHVSADSNMYTGKRAEVLRIMGESRNISKDILIEQEGTPQVQSDRQDDMFEEDVND